jgi:hypothetical protein
MWTDRGGLTNRQRDRKSAKQTYDWMDGGTDEQTGRCTDRLHIFRRMKGQTNREADCQTNWKPYGERNRQKNKLVDVRTNRQAFDQTNRGTNRQMNRWPERCKAAWSDEWREKWTDKQISNAEIKNTVDEAEDFQFLVSCESRKYNHHLCLS